MMTEISQLVLPSATHDSVSCCFFVSSTLCSCPAALPSALAPRSCRVTTHLHQNCGHSGETRATTCSCDGCDDACMVDRVATVGVLVSSMVSTQHPPRYPPTRAKA